MIDCSYIAPVVVSFKRRYAAVSSRLAMGVEAVELGVDDQVLAGKVPGQRGRGSPAGRLLAHARCEAIELIPTASATTTMSGGRSPARTRLVLISRTSRRSRIGSFVASASSDRGFTRPRRSRQFAARASSSRRRRRGQRLQECLELPAFLEVQREEPR